MKEVIEKSWRGGFTTRSDFAREHADYIAIAACKGLITTGYLDGEWGRTWYVTAKGLKYLVKSN
jgi:hypothetical protein